MRSSCHPAAWSATRTWMRLLRSILPPPLLLPLSLLFLPLLPLASTTGCSRNDTAYVQEIDAWHARRIQNLLSDTGWLTLVGLHPLREGINTVGSAEGMDVRLIAKAPARVGTLTVAAGGVVLDVDPGVEVNIAGGEGPRPALHEILASDAEGKPTVCELGSLLFYVIDRGDDLFLRVKDRQSELLRNFPGIERFPVDAGWHVTAHLETFAEGGTVAVPNVLGQTSESPSPGVLDFELAGRSCHLTPLGEPGEELFIVFGDATNGETTYGGGRFLSADPPAADGSVVLDFNKATNPPCAFTPYATCPLPPAGNVLPLAVEAGEKAFGEPRSGPHDR